MCAFKRQSFRVSNKHKSSGRLLRTLPVGYFEQKSRGFIHEATRAQRLWKLLMLEWKTHRILHFTAPTLESGFSWTLSCVLALRTHLLNWTQCEDVNQIRLFDALWLYWSLPAYPCWLIVFAAQDETLILGYWNSVWNQQWQEPRFVSTEVTRLSEQISYAYSLIATDRVITVPHAPQSSAELKCL